MAEATTRFMNIQGEDLAIDVYEPAAFGFAGVAGDAGAVLGEAFLIHGFTGSKEDFLDLGAELAARGYRVATMDNRGMHESANSQRADAYTTKSIAEDARLVAEALGMDRPHLLGHSFGGLVAQNAVIDSPEAWRSLTLFCSGPGALPDVGQLPQMHAWLSATDMATLWDDARDAEARGRVRYEMRKARWHASDKNALLGHANHLMHDEHHTGGVAATGIPVHVVFGENDDAWPLDFQREMAAELNAPVTVIADAGHCPNEDQPAATSEVLIGYWVKN